MQDIEEFLPQNTIEDPLREVRTPGRVFILSVLSTINCVVMRVDYRKISNTRRTKSPNLNVFRLVLY